MLFVKLYVFDISWVELAVFYVGISSSLFICLFCIVDIDHNISN